MSNDFNTKQWIRYTRGRSCQFYATDSEVYEVLKNSLPSKFAPYSLIIFKRIKNGNTYKDDYIETDITEFLKLRRDGTSNYFIRSHEISNKLHINKYRFIDGYLATNGLIIVQHGRISGKFGKCDSSIGLVNKITNTETGEIVTHEEYNKIFNSLKRSIKKILCYTTKVEYLDGRVVESKSVQMSEKFAEQLKSGKIKSKVMVGERIK